MVEFHIKVNPKTRFAYFPKAILELLTRDVTAVPFGKTVVMYPLNTDINEVMDSIELFLEALKGGLKP